jgi:AcrR family transcriptional regulator
MPPPTAGGPPSRRPRISREYLEENRRRRYVDAVAEILHEFSRRQLSVTSIVSLAGTARASFYEVFGGVDECVAYGIGLAAEELFAVLDRQDGEGEWHAEVGEVIAGFYDAVAARPMLAELFLVHSAASRPDHDQAVVRAGGERFTALLGRGRAEAEARRLRPPPALIDECLSHAIVWLAAHQVRGPAVEALPQESERMTALVGAFYLGPLEAGPILTSAVAAAG